MSHLSDHAYEKLESFLPRPRPAYNPAMDDTHIGTDTLSAIGRQLLKLDAEKTYTKLVVDGPGNELAKTSLESLSSRDLIDGPMENSDEADALLAALWLRHDWLEQSHKISQRIETPTGAMWHA